MFNEFQCLVFSMVAALRIAETYMIVSSRVRVCGRVLLTESVIESLLFLLFKASN